jgi:hypothetical protein
MNFLMFYFFNVISLVCERTELAVVGNLISAAASSRQLYLSISLLMMHSSVLLDSIR